MDIDDENGTKRKNFELPGSRAHYAPSLSFTINHMQLEIEPDFQTHTISCKQKLSVIALQDTETIELDAAELQVEKVYSEAKLDFRTLDDKLVVNLG
ncbi:MAG: hypothetical protein M3270_04310, partial [Thermoproteota archaeon]|nr:hypothetical protein [Thermoproteota archaeon]